MTQKHCSLIEFTLAPGIQAITLANAWLALTFLPGKGGDIYSLMHRATNTDVLWKSPQGLRALGQGRLAADSATAWLELYEGGWQEILPNGGDACQYNGVELNFHGESTLLPWEYAVVTNTADEIVVDLSVRLFRSPLHLMRRVTLRADSPAVRFHERVTNWGAAPTDLMWGHHPALGAPLLSDAARLFTSAQTVLIDPDYDPPHNPFVPGARSVWPMAQGKDDRLHDLSRLPSPTDRRDVLAYLMDFGPQAWYAVANAESGFGVGLTWSKEIFRCLWLWQEVHATTGFPWYGRAYTVAVEPWSSYPGFGLAKVIDTTRTHLTLDAGASCAAELSVCMFDWTDARTRVTGVNLDGAITREKV